MMAAATDNGWAEVLNGREAPVSALPARSHELGSIQSLRGIAAMMVVIYHAFPQLQRMGYTGVELHSMSAGVDIFFVISGFIMLYSAHRSPKRGAGEFLINRAIRILPMYWLLTALLVCIALYAPTLLQTMRYERWNAISSFLMFPSLHPSTHVYQPILVPGWTLNCEAFFYVIFALGLWLTRDRGKGLMLFVSAVIGGFLLLPWLVPVSGVMTFYTNSILIEFVYGLVMARLFIAGWCLPRGVGPVLAISGMTLIILTDFVHVPDIRGIFFGVPALMIFTGVIFRPRSSDRGARLLLRVLGDASYSIYLTHMMTMSAAGQAWRHVLGGAMPGNALFFILFGMIVSAIVGIIFYRLVETPVTEYLKNATRPRRAMKLAQS